MLLIIALHDDLHVLKVLTHLKNINYQLLSYRELPISTTVNFNSDTQTYTIQQQNKPPILGTDISAVWYRRPHSTVAHPSTPKPLKPYCQQETLAFLRSLPYLLPQAKWLPNPITKNAADYKLHQLITAHDVGLKCPASTIGNNPDAAREFAQQYPLSAIKALHNPQFSYKATVAQKIMHCLQNPKQIFQQRFFKDLMFGHGIYTQQLSSQEILNITDRITTWPIILQEYVPKAYEVRVTIVDRQIFACAIKSQAQTNENAIDWRHDTDALEHEAITLPPDIHEKCLAFMDRLNLNFGCLDFIVTPEGEYVFLEINPNGQWLWIEEKTGLPISKAIANYLMGQ